MKATLQQLPEAKQEELRSITDTIVQLVQPAMVILFGSYSRGNWVEDSYVEAGTTYTYRSDYDLLVITATAQDVPPRLGKEIRRRVKRAEHLQTAPHLIFHDIAFLNGELEKGHYFFTDIIKEGTLLYTNGQYELATPKELSGKERAEKAGVYFKEWFNRANEFLDTTYDDFRKGRLSKAMFELHQATERYFMTILLVFTDYKPKTHDLDDLSRQASFIDARFKTIFPNHTEEEKRLFNLLVKAYIDSRYTLGYSVAPEDLQWLAQRVEKLKELTEAICEERIAQLAGGA